MKFIRFSSDFPTRYFICSKLVFCHIGFNCLFFSVLLLMLADKIMKGNICCSISITIFAR